ncbi:hypothetical protein C4D60_Mb07t28050 [Musa balbisiana]|uniref:Uncharacterized protein n=1 Tax=Musa balbisiana TaxID=52838 RepID=A0A4S8JIL0_MUSBA|nr:hypothetical protein C4D60_Mb07t28050 [Musa balbisiana]
MVSGQIHLVRPYSSPTLELWAGEASHIRCSGL